MLLEISFKLLAGIIVTMGIEALIIVGLWKLYKKKQGEARYLDRLAHELQVESSRIDTETAVKKKELELTSDNDLKNRANALFAGIILLVALITGCVAGPIPFHELEPPEYQTVSGWEDKDSGLWLPYDEYRKLEQNIIEMEGYILELEATLDYHEEAAGKRRRHGRH
jgi:hypothetical protein